MKDPTLARETLTHDKQHVDTTPRAKRITHTWPKTIQNTTVTAEIACFPDFVSKHMVDGCEILHQLIGGKHPIILFGFQPSFW